MDGTAILKAGSQRIRFGRAQGGSRVCNCQQHHPDDSNKACGCTHEFPGVRMADLREPPLNLSSVSAEVVLGKSSGHSFPLDILRFLLRLCFREVP